MTFCLSSLWNGDETERGSGLARQSIVAILPNAGRRPALPGKRGKTFGWFRWCLAPSPLLYHCITFVGALGATPPLTRDGVVGWHASQ